ncbi:uncharacterized protein MONOS_12321 [Monocercomonoides exilis]|uniref:uncharacterized protein n=1 Tax=Monocercomonoides exilis TaxID=2049356 RepID=UPI00355A78DE|nr:hypothetical protein MONOS_12321 [Monocercomonoides exilis]|eukprot:MONOS_12321.1-p1 / transcript=MONOS_12321.1 / gene=MONOS_12321 / organism=Monocercomonoides_exilis_PA203 / gene_product=unspecified product / transcript_product=unspecified product / location=Mono_scaffold00675:27215-28586(-) / protein_length=440 / sequence_SO=supercontig / SO=protein_coding / is_pseudo=false
MKKTINSASRLCATAEIRELKDAHLKAIYLHNILNIPTREIARSQVLSRSSVQRALAAEKKRNTPGKSGRPTLFDNSDEQYLTTVIIHDAEHGTFHSKMEITQMANDLLKTKRKEGDEVKTVDKHWVKRFLKRHIEISLAKPIALPLGRAAHTSKYSIVPFFDEVKKLFESVNPIPQLLLNLDETSTFSSKQQPELVASSSSTPSAVVPEVHLPTSTSIIFMTSADGCRYLTPILIPFSTLPEEYKLGTTSHEVFIPSLSDHVTSAIFLDMFKKCVITEIRNKRIVVGKREKHAVLIMDGGVGHFQPEILQLCKDNLIDLVKLPSHTSHILQPNDQYIFASMKRVIGKAKKSGTTTSASSKREIFIEILRNGLAAASYPETIKSSWKSTGLWPFNPEKILSNLPDNPPEWALPGVEPKSAPMGSSFGAVYYSSDDLSDLF